MLLIFLPPTCPFSILLSNLLFHVFGFPIEQISNPQNRWRTSTSVVFLLSSLPLTVWWYLIFSAEHSPIHFASIFYSYKTNFSRNASSSSAHLSSALTSFFMQKQKHYTLHVAQRQFPPLFSDTFVFAFPISCNFSLSPSCCFSLRPRQPHHFVPLSVCCECRGLPNVMHSSDNGPFLPANDVADSRGALFF